MSLLYISFAKCWNDVQKGFKDILLTIVVTFALTFSSIASASIIKYNVSGIFDTGSLTGLSYLETFTYNDVTKPIILGITPWETDILSYSLTVDNHAKTWDLADWPLDHVFSQWIDVNGYLNSLAHLATSGPTGNPPAFSDFYDDGAPNSRSKTVKWYDWPRWQALQTDSEDFDPIVSINQIPEPDSRVLIYCALALMCLFRRQQIG